MRPVSATPTRAVTGLAPVGSILPVTCTVAPPLREVFDATTLSDPVSDAAFVTDRSDPLLNSVWVVLFTCVIDRTDAVIITRPRGTVTTIGCWPIMVLKSWCSRVMLTSVVIFLTTADHWEPKMPRPLASTQANTSVIPPEGRPGAGS